MSAPRAEPGTYLYFDEFSNRLHELKAFDEFLSQSSKQFRAIAATPSLSQVAFQCEPMNGLHGTHQVINTE